MQYYWSLIKRKELLVFTFFPSKDYNLFTLKFSLLILIFSLTLVVNGLFFTDSTMHKINENGSSIFTRLPQILFTSIATSVMNILLKNLALSENNILDLKKRKQTKILAKSLKNKLILKFSIFFVISFLLMIFFWYFIGCFCVVYVNTQIILIKDTLASFAASMIYPFGLNLLPGIFRIPALRDKKKNKACLYKVSNLVALI